MKIIIPTMQRVGIQFTAKNLIDAGITNLYKCFMIVPIEEGSLYNEAYGRHFKIISTKLHGINNIRQYAIENCNTEDNKILMMDDDLRFFVRPYIEDVSLFQASSEDIKNMILWLDKQLDNYAHVSISARTQNFQLTSRMERAGSFELITVRPYRIYGFRKDIILGEKLDFHAGLKINTMDDFHMTLNLLELGYTNIVSCKWSHDQCNSNSKGGASTYRDLELLRICALNLKEKHPNVVKVVNKTTRNSWGGTNENPVTRTDVIIQWQKALGIRINESILE
jgi:hypothetical protein